MMWHHMCGTWADSYGVARLFVDGAVKLIGRKSVHGVISGTGKLILGQDQDTPGGAFDHQQGFVGEMTHLYLWNSELESAAIFSLSIHCKEHPHPGYIVQWSDFSHGINGNISRRNNSRCVTKQDMLP